MPYKMDPRKWRPKQVVGHFTKDSDNMSSNVVKFPTVVINVEHPQPYL